MSPTALARLLLLASCIGSLGCASSGDGGDIGAAASTSAPLTWPAMEHNGACGDLLVYAHDETGTHAVYMDLTEASEDLRVGRRFEVELPSPSVDVRLLRGVQVDDFFCNDDPGGAFAVERTWTAERGDASVTMGDSGVHVERLRLDLSDGASIVVEPFEAPIGPEGG